MFEIKELINIGIEEGKDKNKLLEILSNSIDSESSKIETYEKLYISIYGKNHLCDKFCMKFVENMSNETEKGKKWTIDQTNDIARKLGISFTVDTYSQYEFWTVVHMMYYDHKNTISEYISDDNPMIYGKLADDYLDDFDAPKDKLVNYFFYIENSKVI